MLGFFNWLLPSGIFGLMNQQVDTGGDGMKNYFTFAYTIKYNQFPWFNAFLYPYGDLGIYMDNQPILAYLCIKLKNLGLLDPKYASGLLTWFNIFGFMVAGPILYRICQFFKLPTGWSLVGTMTCLVLSPQLFRLGGHFALAYAFNIPLIWLLLLLLNKTKDYKKYGSFIIVLNFLLAWIHPYMLLMNALFIGAYFISYFLIERKTEWRLLILSIIPASLFLVVVKSLDQYSDRGQNALGSWLYKTEIGDLLPFFGWFEYLFKDLIIFRSSAEQLQNGYAYPGALLFLFMVMIFVRILSRLFNKKILWPEFSKEIRISTTVALLLLAFGMGIHMLITDKKIVEWIPYLGNFRALGRFSWGFYYVTFILLIVWFFRYSRLIKSQAIKLCLIVFVSSLYLIDGIAYSTSLKDKLKVYSSDNILINDTELLDIISQSDIEIEDIQAVISYPISVEGIEKLAFNEHFSNKIKVFPFMYQTGIPMVGTTQSRTPISIGMKSLQYANSVYGEFEEVLELERDKAFLIVLLKSLKLQYEDIIARSNYIGSTDKLEIYSISTQNLFERKTYNDYISAIDSLSVPSDKDYKLELFDNQNIKGLHSNGAYLTVVAGEEFYRTDFKVDSASVYELSFWQLVEPVKCDVAEYSITVSNRDELKTINLSSRERIRTEVNGSWLRFKTKLQLSEGSNIVRLNCSHPNMLIDWLCIQKAGSHILKTIDNSHWIYTDHHFMLKE